MNGIAPGLESVCIARVSLDRKIEQCFAIFCFVAEILPRTVRGAPASRMAEWRHGLLPLSRACQAFVFEQTVTMSSVSWTCR